MYLIIKEKTVSTQVLRTMQCTKMTTPVDGKTTVTSHVINGILKTSSSLNKVSLMDKENGKQTMFYLSDLFVSFVIFVGS